MKTFDELFTAENKGNMEYNTWAMVQAICAATDEFRKLREIIEAARDEDAAE